MKIFPDAVYAHMQCGASRLSDGSTRVVPFVSEKVPDRLVPEKFRRLVLPGVICIPTVAAFYEPTLMFPIVLMWVIAAWMVGACPHCATPAEQDAHVSADQDNGDL